MEVSGQTRDFHSTSIVLPYLYSGLTRDQRLVSGLTRDQRLVSGLTRDQRVVLPLRPETRDWFLIRPGSGFWSRPETRETWFSPVSRCRTCLRCQRGSSRQVTQQDAQRYDLKTIRTGTQTQHAARPNRLSVRLRRPVSRSIEVWRRFCVDFVGFVWRLCLCAKQN